jgi:phosphohistidine phosphatase
MNLILWRHAEAEDIAPDHTDAGRRLTERGQKQAQRMAAWLHAHLPADARILASPAVRTQQTAAALAATGRTVETDERLFTDADVNDYFAASHWGSGDAHNNETIVLVGHQPTLGQLAAALMCGQTLPWSVKKGAIWWLGFEGEGMPARLVCALDTKQI